MRDAAIKLLGRKRWTSCLKLFSLVMGLMLLQSICIRPV